MVQGSSTLLRLNWTPMIKEEKLMSSFRLSFIDIKQHTWHGWPCSLMMQGSLMLLGLKWKPNGQKGRIHVLFTSLLHRSGVRIGHLHLEFSCNCNLFLHFSHYRLIQLQIWLFLPMIEREKKELKRGRERRKGGALKWQGYF